MAAAGVTVKFTFDPRGLHIFEHAVEELGPGKVNNILHYTLDQVGKRLSTQVRKELVKQTSIPRSEIDRCLRDIQSSASKLVYTVEGISHHEPLSKSWFRPHESSVGVSATPWNRPRLFPNTFIDRFAGWVFKREGEGRKMLWGPSIASEMERGVVPEAFKAYGEQLLPLAIEKKLKQFLP